MGNFYPGSGGMFGAKPNLYIEGTANTDVSVRVILKEEGSNWLASVPAHGALGWKGKLDNRNFLKTDRGDYRFIYYDFRMFGKQFQDQEGFCTQKENVIPRIAQTMNEAGFNGVEIADFLEYWSVKFPNSENYCVYPQDNRQLDTVLRLEITPKPASVQRLLFMVQVQDRLVKNGKKFTAPPKKEWHPMPSRALASDRNSAELKIREWGIGFFGALR
ncbi:MAG TPA: hypothetical protein VJB59_02915 [Bdellovibrionota bacterium]|nr:hypothetical protein [Bdellovibrionota bacterium]